MAITTLAGVLSGLIPPQPFAKAAQSGGTTNIPVSYWASGGFPRAGSYDSTLNGVALTSPITGQIPFTNPASGNTYLAKLSGTVGSSGSSTVHLMDRLWHNGGIATSTATPQTIVTPTWPARDDTGSTGGVGVILAIEASAATAATVNASISYTNSGGVSGRTSIGGNIINVYTGDFIYMTLQAGDVGVQSVQSITVNLAAGVVVNVVAYRRLATVTNPFLARSAVGDAVSLGMPRMFNSSVPFLVAETSATWDASSSLVGHVLFTQG